MEKIELNGKKYYVVIESTYVKVDEKVLVAATKVFDYFMYNVDKGKIEDSIIDAIGEFYRSLMETGAKFVPLKEMYFEPSSKEEEEKGTLELVIEMGNRICIEIVEDPISYNRFLGITEVG